GWWEEAYGPEVGWAIPEVNGVSDNERDRREAERLYAILETEVAPEFYIRDEAGLPRQWLTRIRSSMSQLAPVYSTARMMQEMIERLYLPAAAEFRRRAAGNIPRAALILAWESRLRHGWSQVHIGEPRLTGSDATGWQVSAPVYLGEIG